MTIGLLTQALVATAAEIPRSAAELRSAWKLRDSFGTATSTS